MLAMSSLHRVVLASSQIVSIAKSHSQGVYVSVCVCPN